MSLGGDSVLGNNYKKRKSKPQGHLCLGVVCTNFSRPRVCLHVPERMCAFVLISVDKPVRVIMHCLDL